MSAFDLLFRLLLALTHQLFTVLLTAPMFVFASLLRFYFFKLNLCFDHEIIKMKLWHCFDLKAFDFAGLHLFKSCSPLHLNFPPLFLPIKVLAYQGQISYIYLLYLFHRGQTLFFVKPFLLLIFFNVELKVLLFHLLFICLQFLQISKL